MHERPILFSAPMVRAILAGTKTQTRRIIKPQPGPCEHSSWPGQGPDWHPDTDGWHCGVCGNGVELAHTKSGVRGVRCPFGVPGDRLWVKEAILLQDPNVYREQGYISVYEADSEPTPCDTWCWKRDRLNSIHCPRGLSRIDLDVTNIRVERLQDITEDDAKEEGVTPFQYDIEGDCWTDGKHRTAFEYLWGQINHERAPWSSNPWVWVVEFKRAESQVTP